MGKLLHFIEKCFTPHKVIYIKEKRKENIEMQTYAYIRSLSKSFSLLFMNEDMNEWFPLEYFSFCFEKIISAWNCARDEKGIRLISIYVLLTSPYEGRNE
jgi:hypothetical protein